MSKSKGNAIDPFEIIGQEGADAVRWYMLSNTPPWENLKFSTTKPAGYEEKVFQHPSECVLVFCYVREYRRVYWC